MDFSQMFAALHIHYGTHKIGDLAVAMRVERPTLSGWKNREAIGPLLAHLAENDPSALSYIFSTNKGIEKAVGIVTPTIPQGRESPLFKYFSALEAIASAENREDELLEHFKNLIQKYMGKVENDYEIA